MQVVEVAERNETGWKCMLWQQILKSKSYKYNNVFYVHE